LFLLFCLRGLNRAVLSLSSFAFEFADPNGRGTARAHQRARTRTGGTEPASHPTPGRVPASGGRGGAVRLRWIPRNRPRAARAGALKRSAVASEVDVQSLPPTVATRPGGSVSRDGSAPQ